MDGIDPRLTLVGNGFVGRSLASVYSVASIMLSEGYESVWYRARRVT